VALKMQLRIHARSGTHPDQRQAATLMDYRAGRGADIGPLSQSSGGACGQVD
jgi:hypothetical protein